MNTYFNETSAAQLGYVYGSLGMFDCLDSGMGLALMYVAFKWPKNHRTRDLQEHRILIPESDQWNVPFILSL